MKDELQKDKHLVNGKYNSWVSKGWNSWKLEDIISTLKLPRSQKLMHMIYWLQKASIKTVLTQLGKKKIKMNIFESPY